MKNLFYTLAFIALISILTSCTPKPEEMILGAWNLEKSELENIDEFAQNMIDMQVLILDEQITQLQTQIDESSIEGEVETLQPQLDALLAQKAELTIEKFKEGFLPKLEEMTDGFVLDFAEDKSYTKLPENNKGTWDLNEDASEITITGDDGESKNFTITELSAEKLVLKIEDGEEEMKMVMIMSFTKGEDEVTDTTDEDVEETDEETTE